MTETNVEKLRAIELVDGIYCVFLLGRGAFSNRIFETTAAVQVSIQ